ncbi:DUF397 domain-containing protein [Streptomyces sp. RP5T]|nr:DUF397 domain-containing protein [Streptomyces sp. RP5T]
MTRLSLAQRDSVRLIGGIQVALNHPRTVAVRDSKNPGGPVIQVVPGAWGSFVRGLRHARP